MAGIQFVTSKRGCPQLYIDGYLYSKDKETNEKIIFRCVKYQKSQTNCKARIHLDLDNQIIKDSSNEDHNHPGQAAEVKGRAIVQNITKSALDNLNLNPKAIIAQAATEVTDAVAAQMPFVRTISRSIRKKRQVQREDPPIPAKLSDFEVPENIQKLPSGENFLLCDTGKDDENRILIFGTQKGLKKLKNFKEWYADGCFSLGQNKIFKQLYTIHAKRKHGIYPGVYVLLQNKRQETYEKMLDLVKKSFPHLFHLNINKFF